MVICLERVADLLCPSWCHCHSLSLASVKSRLVLPFWYRLTWVVLEKGPLNVCVCSHGEGKVAVTVGMWEWRLCNLLGHWKVRNSPSICWNICNISRATASSYYSLSCNTHLARFQDITLHLTRHKQKFITSTVSLSISLWPVVVDGRLIILHAVWNSQTFSVLWRCWLGGRKGIWPVKNGCWHGYLFGARCRLAYGPADAIATHCLLLQWNPAFTFLLPAHPGSPGHWAIKRVCVCSTPAYLMLPASSCF